MIQYDVVYAMSIDDWIRALLTWNRDNGHANDVDCISQFDAYCGIDVIDQFVDSQGENDFRFKVVDHIKFMRMMLLWGVKYKIA